MDTDGAALLLAGKDILPITRGVAAGEDILVHARAADARAARAAAQTRGPPRPLARDLELHGAPDGLRHAEGLAQRLHAQVLLRRLPRLQTRLERVAGYRGRRSRRGGGEAGGGWVQTLAENVVDAGRGGR